MNTNFNLSAQLGDIRVEGNTWTEGSSTWLVLIFPEPQTWISP